MWIFRRKQWQLSPELLEVTKELINNGIFGSKLHFGRVLFFINAVYFDSKGCHLVPDSFVATMYGMLPYGYMEQFEGTGIEQINVSRYNSNGYSLNPQQKEWLKNVCETYNKLLCDNVRVLAATNKSPSWQEGYNGGIATDEQIKRWFNDKPEKMVPLNEILELLEGCSKEAEITVEEILGLIKDKYGVKECVKS